MNKYFVTKKQAILLKKLGYNKKSIGYYTSFSNKLQISAIPTNHNRKKIPYNIDGKPEYYSAPLNEEAIDWLEKKGYIIRIYNLVFFNKSKIIS